MAAQRLARLGQLRLLALLAPAARESSPLGIAPDEFIEHDAAPFQLIDLTQQSRPLDKRRVQ